MDAFLLHFRSFSVSISQFYLQVKYLFPMASCLSAWLLGLAWLFVYLTDYILFPFMIPGPCQLALHIIAECWWNWSYRHHQILTFWTLRFFLFSSSQITSQCCFWFKKECHIRNSWSLQGEDCWFWDQICHLVSKWINVWESNDPVSGDLDSSWVLAGNCSPSHPLGTFIKKLDKV